MLENDHNLLSNNWAMGICLIPFSRKLMLSYIRNKQRFRLSVELCIFLIDAFPDKMTDAAR